MAETKPETAPELLPAKEVPEFSSWEEEAEWYDTHDTSQLETEPVDDGPFDTGDWKPKTIPLRLQRFEAEELARRAEVLGVSVLDYVILLVNRRVLDEEPLK